MNALQVAFKPEGQWTDEQFATFMMGLETWYKAKEVMDIEEMAKFVGIGQTKLYSLGPDVFPFHKIPGIKKRFYIKSEVMAKIKGS